MKISKTIKSSFFICALVMTMQGCVDEIDPEREVRERGTFGEELYKIVYKNSEYSANHSSAQFLQTFEKWRPQFVDAVDTSIMPSDYEALNQVFIDIVPLYENMLYPEMLRKIATAVGEISEQPAAVAGMHYLLAAPNVQRSPAEANPFGLVLGYENIAGITDTLMALILKNSDGDRNATDQLLKEISIVIGDIERDESPTRFVKRAYDMLFRSDDIYAPSGSYSPQMASYLGSDGHPLFADGIRAADSPFTDKDGDGAADKDEDGWFIADGGRVGPFENESSAPNLAIGSDGQLIQDGKPVFSTFDLQKTPLAYLLREGDEMFADATMDQALRAVQKLLGEPQTYTDAHGAYTGYSRVSSLAQLASALLTTLDHDSVGPNFEAAVWLLKNDKDTVAQILHDIEVVFDIIDENPSKFSTDNDLIDRLLPELLEIAETPGLLNDLLISLDDPMAANIAPILSRLAQTRNSFIAVDSGSRYDTCFWECSDKYNVGTPERMHCIQACPTDEVLGPEKVDHNAPESFENRSIFQRITNLMWETSEVPYAVSVTGLAYVNSDTGASTDLTPLAQLLGTMISFDNLAEAYLLTISGDLKLSEHISPSFLNLAKLIGADGETVAGLLSLIVDNFLDLKLSVNPTAAEVTRMFNRPILRSETSSFTMDLNVALCKSGHRCLEVSADTLLAMEASGLVDALYPVIKVFNKYKKTAVFARLVSILFEYYPSGEWNGEYKDKNNIEKYYYHTVKYDESGREIKDKPIPIQPMNFRSIEPVLIKALKQTNIVADVGALCDALLRVVLKDGSALTSRFENFVRYILTPDANLKNIRGESFTYARNHTYISPLSPAYLYIDAFRAISDDFDRNPGLEDQFKDALDGVKKVTIHTIEQDDGTYAFEKPAGIHIFADILDMMHDIFIEHTEKGDRHPWIHETAIPKVLDLFSGRLLYAYFQLFNDLDADPEGLENFRRLILHIMESGKEDPHRLTGAFYQVFSWLLEQNHLADFAASLASPIDPDRRWTTPDYPEMSFVKTILTTVNAFNQCDPTHAFNRVFYNLFETDSRERANVVRLFDVANDLFRVNPGSPEPLRAADLKVLLDFAEDLFFDSDRGIERIYSVIDYTLWGTAGRPENWRENVRWEVGSDKPEALKSGADVHE